jgi:hypothetical protein
VENTTMMLAFHGQSELKTQVLALLAEHREADRLVKGHYWECGKGCAVGCTLESIRRIRGDAEIAHGDHSAYEEYLGVPRALARLEDGLFENLPNGTAQGWPERFTSAIRPGADLSMVVPKFLHWLLSDPEGGVQRAVKDRPKQKAAINAVAALYARWIEQGTKPSVTEWREARRAADAAAAYAAYAAYAADAYAAYAAAAAADAADAAAARSCERIRQADKLIELLEAA